MSVMFWIWLGVIVVSTIIELATFSLTSIWFAFGGIFALLLSLIKGMPWSVQVIVFVAISSLLLVFLRKIALKFMYKHHDEDDKTNLNAIIGTKVRMITKADFENMGTIKVNGIVWSVKPKNNDEVLEENELVEIVQISGNKIIAKKIVPTENTEQNKEDNKENK